MKKDGYEKLIFSIEASLSEIKYDFEIAEFFSDLLNQHKDMLTPEQEQQLKWEFLLFRLTTKNSFASGGLKVERFVPMATFEDGTVFPDPNSLDAALVYFAERAKEAKSPILKARYLDFLWTKSAEKKKHLFAIEAIDQYLLVVDEYKDDAIKERLDGLQRGAELALILEAKQDNKPLSQKVVTKLNGVIEVTANSKEYRWLIEMFELVLALPSFYNKEQIEKFIALCDAAAEQYYINQNFHLQRSFLQLKASLWKIVDSSLEAQKSISEEIGKSWIDEAEAKSGSGLVKVHFLQQAIDHYAKLRDVEKVKELTTEVKAATTQAIENNEFKQFSSTVEMKKEDIERMKASLGVGDEVPERIGTVTTFFPRWDQAVKMTEKHKREFVFMHLFGKVSYGNKYPVHAPQTPEEEQEDQVMDNFKIMADLSLEWLTGFLEELKKDKKISLKDFKKFFSMLNTIDADTYETVMDGLKSYFKGDHFHATYVLTLQLEDFLRQLLSVFGEETTVREAGAFREKTLGSVLRELKLYISEPVYRYISWVMEDYRGFNLRNDIAHGFFKKRRTNPIYSTAIIHVFCLLIANTKISVKEQK